MLCSTWGLTFLLTIMATFALAIDIGYHQFDTPYPDINGCLTEERYESISEGITNHLAAMLDELARKIEDLPKQTDIEELINKQVQLKCNSSDCVGGAVIAGKCLTFSTEKLSWSDARESCSSQNGSLVTLNDPQAFKNYVASNYDGGHFWLGGSDITNEASWVWLNGEPFGEQFPWHEGEPTALFANEDCLLLWGGYQLLDAPCDRQYGYVCEKDPQHL